MKTSILIAAALIPVSICAAEPFKIPVNASHVKDMLMFGAYNQTDWTGGTSTGFSDFFDGNYNNGLYMPIWTPSGQRSKNGQYMIIDLTKLRSDGYYVTEIKVWELGEYAYSLYYSTDGNAWTGVGGASQTTQVGENPFSVNDYATHVKVVFDVVSDWNPGVSEIEIWGLKPEDVSCPHDEEFLTEWAPVESTATCTEFGIDQRQCTKCGEWIPRRSQTALPIGHAYECQLDEPGTDLHYGGGRLRCTRCSYEIVFPEDAPLDMVTHRVDDVKIGGVAANGVVRFMDVTVSSTGDTGSGIRPEIFLDGTWLAGWGNRWFASSTSSDEYALFTFAAEIDLTAVDISGPNRSHTVQFYGIAPNGEEKLVGEWSVVKDTTIPDKVGDSENSASFQRNRIEFRGVSIKALRVRSDDETTSFSLCELHPYGTVKGAGKLPLRTRIIID